MDVFLGAVAVGRWCGGEWELSRGGRPRCETTRKTLAARVDEAMGLISRYGYIDGAHHKQWVLDQVARALLGPEAYERWAEADEDGGEWDTGIAP